MSWQDALLAVARIDPCVEVRLTRLEVLPGPDQRACRIDRMVTENGMRGQGHAHAVLKRLCQAADRDQVLLHLTPEPVPRLRGTERGMRMGQLLAWYTRNGFRPNTGRKRELRVMDSMIRVPRGDISG